MRLPCSPCSATTFWRLARRASGIQLGRRYRRPARAACARSLSISASTLASLDSSGLRARRKGAGAARLRPGVGLAVDDRSAAFGVFACRLGPFASVAGRQASRGSLPDRRRTSRTAPSATIQKLSTVCAAGGGRARPATCCRRSPPAPWPALRAFPGPGGWSVRPAAAGWAAARRSMTAPGAPFRRLTWGPPCWSRYRPKSRNRPVIPATLLAGFGASRARCAIGVLSTSSMSSWCWWK